MVASKKSKLAAMTDEVGQLHPLLQKLLPKLPHVVRVEYTHGRTEMGADFVISKHHDTFKHMEYVGVIVKLGKIIQDFSDVERQIDECAVPRTFSGGKERIRLDEIWVVVTEHITKGAQDKIHEKYKARKITFIDGSMLEHLVDEHIPAFWSDVSLEVGEYLSSLQAMNTEKDRSFSLLQTAHKDFYIEQDIYEFPRSDYQRKIRHLKHLPRKVDIYNVIEKQDFVLIEGGMGSGKSKLIRKLINYYATPEVFIEKKITANFHDICRLG
jgi:hypothetical protein